MIRVRHKLDDAEGMVDALLSVMDDDQLAELRRLVLELHGDVGTTEDERNEALRTGIRRAFTEVAESLRALDEGVLKI